MKTAIVFVEGGYDYRVLAQFLPNVALVVQGTGKYGQSSFIDGYAKSQGATTSKIFIGFRDRDFDKAIPEKCELETQEINDSFSGKTIAFSYRRTIENYLLRPESFEFFLEKNSSSFSTLNSLLIRELLLESAYELRYYQAVRQALGEVRDKNLLTTSWTDKSGKIPQQLDEGYCLEKGRELLTTYDQKATQIANIGKFEELFRKYVSLFDNETFYQNRLHEVWFQGKDLEKVLQTKLQKYAPSFPMNRLYESAISNFEYQEFPDLTELRTLIIKKTESQ